jgi:energy-coupling factor transporter ATP-binding protein EcfA2
MCNADMLKYVGASFRYEAAHDARSVGAGQRPAVDDVHLAVAAASLLLLAGGSGSGKSTLVRMANGLIPHFHAGEFRGSVRVGGVDTRDNAVRDLAAKVGVVFQNQEAQLFNATVERELAFGPRNQGLPRAAIAARIRWAAERTGITHLLPRPTHQLSGGESARVAIACVLTMRPPLLVLDEPSAALDPVAVASLWTLLADLNRDGTGVVVAEHRVEPAWADATGVVVMREGRLRFDGTLPEALRASLDVGDLPVPSVTRLFIDAGLPERPTMPGEAAAIMRVRRLSLHGCPDHHATPGDLLLRAAAVTYERDHRVALDCIDVRLHRGESVAVVGANGAGKTTLLRLLAGLIHPSRGRVTGPDGAPFPPARLAMLLQNADDALFCPTVREEVEYSARMLARYDPGWLHELFVRFALEDLRDRPPLGLSDGEKRRVALAAMLAHRPEVVLLDEPTAGQDAPRSDALADMIAALRAGGAAVLMATHDLAFAAAHCPRWLVLAEGQLVADTTPAAVLGDAALLARAHLLPTPIARLAAELGVPYPGETVTLRPHPEMVQAP